MDNKTLKNKLMNLAENIDTRLINTNEVQACDLDLIVTQDITVSQISDWFHSVAPTGKSIFIMSQDTYKIIRKLQYPNGEYAWDAGFNGPSVFLGVPYILKAKI